MSHQVAMAAIWPMAVPAGHVQFAQHRTFFTSGHALDSVHVVKMCLTSCQEVPSILSCVQACAKSANLLACHNGATVDLKFNSHSWMHRSKVEMKLSPTEDQQVNQAVSSWLPPVAASWQGTCIQGGSGSQLLRF